MFYFFGIFIVVISFVIVNGSLSIQRYQRKYVYWFALLAGTVWISLRPMELPDIKAYKDFFRYIEPFHNYGFSFINRHLQTGFEYGFVYLVSFVKIFTGENFRLTWFVLSFSSTAITIGAIKGICNTILLEKDNPVVFVDGNNRVKDYFANLVGLGVFCSYFFICYQGIAIRAAFSLAFFLVSVYVLIQKKYIKTVVFFVLCVMMQRIGLVGLIVYPVYLFLPRFKRKKQYTYVMSILFIMILLIYFSPLYGVFLQLMSRLYNNLFSVVNYRGYVEKTTIFASFDRKRIMIVLISLFCLYFCPDNEKSRRLFNIFFAGVIVLLLTMNVDGSARIYDYLTVFYMPLLVIEFSEHRGNLFYRIGVNVIMIMNFYISFRVWGII